MENRITKMRTFLFAVGVTLLLLVALGNFIAPKAWAADTNVNDSVKSVDTALAVGVEGTEVWTSCTPVQIMTYQNRVHVRCASAVGGISYFATPTSDAQNAARVLSVISTAQAAGRTLTILYDASDLSGASFGCQTNDCRKINAIGFGS